LALAPTLRLPDLLVGRDGTLVAVLEETGHLTAAGVKRSSFELARWLEHDGDTRTVQEAGGASGFFCDAVGCRTRVEGLTVAVAQRPAAFADDCRRASHSRRFHREPEELLGPEGGGRFLRRAPGGHARALHR
jgi:competence protein ComEC